MSNRNTAFAVLLALFPFSGNVQGQDVQRGPVSGRDGRPETLQSRRELSEAAGGESAQPGGELHAIDNPVLPGVADAGVLKYNGEYYIGGVSTDGSFYRSSNLVDWEGPFHVFSMDNDWTAGPSANDSEIHASDVHYLNGLFHHYWSVNYWGEDQHVVHIGHAVSPRVLGPYTEPLKDTWLDNRIDPHLFRDKDGKLYMYMVKFTDGNTIWVRPMKDPSSFSGEPRYLFASLPGTWETLDNRVAEGPWVIRYRGQYYLMYNANHTSPAWGNYSFGVAQAGGPLEFNHGSKYPHPVLNSNQWDLEDLYPDLLEFSPAPDSAMAAGASGGPASRPQGSAGEFSYTFSEPGDGWNRKAYDDSAWQKGKPGFGSAVIEQSATRPVRTPWTGDRIWLRKAFHVDKEDAGNLSLRMHHDGETRVFLNGSLIYGKESRQYVQWNFDKKARSLLQEGENLLAVESRAGGRSAFLDVSLFDLEDGKADDILFSPGQPNIVRGPNGFEWWLVYMANKNADRRGQYINRVHFFDKKLVVDGITGANTAGYHPPPAAPAFQDLFNDGDQVVWKRKWNLLGGSWSLADRQLLQTDDASAALMPRTRPASHYLFEAAVKIIPGESTGAGAAGVYAFRKDEDNWLKLLFDPENGKWVFELKQEGKLQQGSFPLPGEFDYEAYHKISVFKNGAVFRVDIDDIPAPGQPVIEAPGLAGPGLPGLLTEGTGAAFDGILYTIGWDEFDQEISGWEPPAGPAAKAWKVSEEGIGPGAEDPDVSRSSTAGPAQAESGWYEVFKGDALEQYEFSLQINCPETGRGAAAGIYAAYVDRSNYLKAVLDHESWELVISGKKNGKPLETHRLPLEAFRAHYADMKFTDFIEKHFTFGGSTWVNSLRFSKRPHGQQDIMIEDIYRNMDIFYESEGRWRKLEHYRETPSSHPGFDRIAFEPVKTTAIKLVNKEARDHNFYTYKLWANELMRESSNLRVSRLGNAMIFWVNGKEIFRTGIDFPASRVGLTTTTPRARFNGITFFGLGAQEAF